MKTIIVGFIALLLAQGQAAAAEVEHIDVQREGSRVQISARIVIDASVGNVYRALLEYDRFDQMGDTFAESRYVEPAADGDPQIYTRTEGCIWFFCKTIERHARLELTANQKIVAIADPQRSDAAYSVETWLLSVDGESTVVDYQHELDTGFRVPPLIGALIINRSVKRGTQKAALRIQALAAGPADILVAQN